MPDELVKDCARVNDRAAVIAMLSVIFLARTSSAPFRMPGKPTELLT